MGGRIPEDAGVQVTLAQWRHMAANALIAASSVVYLPVVVLLVAGEGPPLARPVQALVLVAYAVVVACALPYRTDYWTRAWLLLASGYVLAVVANIAFPQGPMARAMPAMLPLQTMVLFGARAGRIATVAGVVILMFAPLLHDAPGLVGILTTAPAEAPIPLGVVCTQGAGMSAVLVATAILMDRFHGFLLQSLARWQQEANERSTAHRTLEREMEERRRLEREVARTGDEERRRLGTDIHDGVCQQLTGALLRCEALVRRVNRGEALAPENLTALSSLLEEAIDEAHAVARGLCPLDPEPGALSTALRTLTKRTQGATAVPCLFTATGDVGVPDPTMAQHLYRIAQEALSNAARHAHAKRIALELRGCEDGLFLQVEDDGDGMPDGLSSTGMGLRTMVYRANLLEGELTVTPAPTGGTRISCRVPRGSVAAPDECPQTTGEVNHGN